VQARQCSGHFCRKSGAEPSKARRDPDRGDVGRPGRALLAVGAGVVNAQGLYEGKEEVTKGLLLTMLLISLTPLTGAAEMARTALVVGNSAYEIGPLRNPSNDATDMAQKLEALGFDVIFRTNVNKREFVDALREFKRHLQRCGAFLLRRARGSAQRAQLSNSGRGQYSGRGRCGVRGGRHQLGAALHARGRGASQRGDLGCLSGQPLCPQHPLGGPARNSWNNFPEHDLNQAVIAPGPVGSPRR